MYALQKQPILINFQGGLDTKTDPYQVPVGKFLRLQNTIFNKFKRMTKRNGFSQITTVPETVDFLTTFNGNLTGIGNNLLAYIQGPNKWVSKGSLQPLSLDTLSLIRSNTNQSSLDAVVSDNDLVCVTYVDTGSGTTLYKYAVIDSVTGQNVIAPTLIPSSGTVTSAARVFFLAPYFIIVFGEGSTNLEYVYVNSVNPVSPVSSIAISTQFTNSSSLAFDGYVANNRLYLAWNGSDIGNAVRIRSLTKTLVLDTVKVFATQVGTIFSVYADESSNTPNIWVSYWDSSSTNGHALVVDQNLNTILAPTQIITTTSIVQLTSTASNGVNTFLYEIPNNYGYDSSIPTHYIERNTITRSGTVGSPSVLVRSVGLASKAFLLNNKQYFLSAYQSSDQNSYFLIDANGQVVSKLAYSNGGGYVTAGLPNVSLSNNVVSLGYQFQDFISTVTKNVTDNVSSIYAQTGINFVNFTFSTSPKTAEIGKTLSLTGGFLWGYDGYIPVENNFFLWPDNVEVTTSSSGGSIGDQEYFYQVIYQWTDNQGNIQSSAPSIPVSVTTTGGNTSTNTINIPTLRLTYKTANPVQIVVYRWSTGQQEFHRTVQADGTGSITKPLFNNLTVDYVTFTDTLSDADILGNDIIYTTGNVVENTGAPSFNDIALFDSRLWGIDAEDTNLLWYSKQVIENVPVDMSDLFTYYTAPSTAVEGSSGPTRCIFPMDDKLILFKDQAIYFINGNGPDNTGLNSSYSPTPIFIAGTVGCSNSRSIALIPQGLMFQSDKGIWLLGRDLNTQYIGAAVEDFTLGVDVLSAIAIPETTQIRFTMSSGITLMYDYFFEQWGTFVNIPAISSVIWNSLHTYVDNFNRVFQESPGLYLDGSAPVLQALTTSWISVSGLTGLQRVYWLNLLGTYISPHNLQIGVAYDYNSNPIQSTTVLATNYYGGQWGNDVPIGNPGVWGGSQIWGSGQSVERQRVFLEHQKCRSVQFIIDEIYDPSFGVMAGEGLSLSGLNITAGFKKSYPTPAAANSFG